MGAVKRYRRTLSASTLEGDPVVDTHGRDVGRVEELMIDVQTGAVAYVVLSFGGFLGIGDKLFAIPWSMVSVDEINQRFVVDLSREQLMKAPGFDKDHWPDLSDLDYAAGVYRHYDAKPYWE